MPILVIAILIVALMLASAGGGYVFGARKYHDLTAALATKADAFITITKTIETTRWKTKQADVVFHQENAAKIEQEIKDANTTYPPICFVDTELLNSSIDRAGSAGELHDKDTATIPAAGAK